MWQNVLVMIAIKMKELEMFIEKRIRE